MTLPPISNRASSRAQANHDTASMSGHLHGDGTKLADPRRENEDTQATEDESRREYDGEIGETGLERCHAPAPPRSFTKAIVRLTNSCRALPRSGRRAQSPNLFDFGKPLGGRRPASARFATQSRRSSLATVQVRPAVSFQVRPSFSLKTLASETPPSL